MNSFKVPESIPQDLLFIRDLLGPQFNAPEKTVPKPAEVEDDIDSSGSECSEDEIQAELVELSTALSSSDSDSDSESSSSVADDDEKTPHNRKIQEQDATCEEEDEAGPSGKQQPYCVTKNEVIETEVPIPEFEEVGPDEILEKVGEIMNIINKLVIVKGLPSGSQNQGPSQTLDSETLLVFDDRQVLGYIYDTFGPTTEPLYQVKFNDVAAINTEKVRISREVFHLPQRSRFVFVNPEKGSDASNWNDEEPPEHEMEFSDDEAEAEFKRNRKAERAHSVASSRHGTPAVSQMPDSNFPYPAGSNAYDEQGPYDVDFSAQPSRPMPVPYDDDPYTPDYGSSRPAPVPYDDDPYSDNFTGGVISETTSDKTNALPSASTSRFPSDTGNVRRGNGMGSERRPVRGRRGRGRGRGRGERNNGGSTAHESHNAGESDSRMREAPPPMPYDPSIPYDSQSSYTSSTIHPPAPHDQYYPMQSSPVDQWGNFAPQWNQPPMVMPHINPQFASQFGMTLGYPPHQYSLPYQQYHGGIQQQPYIPQPPQPMDQPRRATWRKDERGDGGGGMDAPMR